MRSSSSECSNQSQHIVRVKLELSRRISVLLQGFLSPQHAATESVYKTQRLHGLGEHRVAVTVLVRKVSLETLRHRVHPDSGSQPCLRTSKSESACWTR